MILSELLVGAVRPYMEYAWRCAPNEAGQSIGANAITTLVLNAVIADKWGYGSLASNQLSLPRGVYLYKFSVPFIDVQGTRGDRAAGLYNVSDGAWVSMEGGSFSDSYYGGKIVGDGQLEIAAAKTFELRLHSASGVLVRNQGGGSVGASTFTSSAAGMDQRTTLKLWKLA